MPTVAAIKRVKRTIGPLCNGVSMTPSEFDRADFEDGWRYELIHGVLVVSPIPSLNVRDPVQELGHWLRKYKETHPNGKALDFTIYAQTSLPVIGSSKVLTSHHAALSN
jgi:hypothetical protein